MITSCIFLLLLSTLSTYQSFKLPPIPHRNNYVQYGKQHQKFSSYRVLDSSLQLSANNNTSGSSDTMSAAQVLREQALRVRLEAEKLEAELALEKVNMLESRFKAAANPNITEMQPQVETLAKKFVPNFIPLKDRTTRTNKNIVTKDEENAQVTLEEAFPSGYIPYLTPAEVSEASDAFCELPAYIRVALAKAVDIDLSGDYDKLPSSDKTETVVIRLYEEKENLLRSNSQKLKDSVNYALMSRRSISPGVELMKELNSTFKIEMLTSKDLENYSFDNLEELLEEGEYESRRRRFMQVYYPDRTRKEGLAPTLEDAEYFMYDILDAKNVFNPTSKPEKTEGGYIIRGENRMKDAETMVTEIDKVFKDSKLNEKYQFYLVRDPTPDQFDDMGDILGSPLLMLMSNDMKPATSPFVLSLISSASLFLAFLFTLGSFSSNPTIVNRLKEDNALGNYDVTWFNELLLPLLGSLFAIQLAHELSHFVVSKKDDVSVFYCIIFNCFLKNVTHFVNLFLRDSSKYHLLL